jgi:hypothetical protein
MGIVLALLAMEVGAVVVLVGILGLEALVRGPRLDQRAVDREVLVRQQRFDLGLFQQLGHELVEHLALLKALAVLGEGGGVPHPIVGRQSDEPAEQQIIVELLHQQPLRPQAIKHLQQQGAQQLLRRDRGL